MISGAWSRAAIGLGLLMCGLVPLMAGCSRAPEVLYFEGPTMGTSYHITVVAPPREFSRDSIEDGLRSRLERIDQLMSTWRDDSEIMAVNRAPPGEWVALSPENHALFAESLRIYQLTGGRFDITVGPLIDLWGFGADVSLATRLPADKEIAQAMSLVGSTALELRDDPPAIRKAGQRRIDYAGIAPGYAVDLIALWFEQERALDYMIEIGGEVRTAGHNPQGGKWRIGIESPETVRGGIAAAVHLSGESVSTSGDYRDYFEVDGKRYSHTIDPLSGRPIEHNLASVTVITPDCTSADALATALDVMGPQEGMAFAESQHLPVLMLLRRPDGSFESRASTAFAAYTKD